MHHQQRPIVLVCIMLLFATAFLGADEKATTTTRQKGTELGNYVPTTTTWVVVSPTFSKYNGKNTCLAGVYRQENVISIYAQTEDKHVWQLLRAIDRGLQGHPKIKAYVVINKPLRDSGGTNLSTERFFETKTLALAYKFRQIDVSLCRSPSKLLFDEGTLVKFVYSEQRVVKISQRFSTSEQPLKEIAALLEDVHKVSTAK